MFLKMFLNMPILRSGVTQVVFINECKSCKTSNQMVFSVVFSFLNCVWHKYCKIKLFSGTILHGASNEPETYLESSQTSTRDYTYKNS